MTLVTQEIISPTPTPRRYVLPIRCPSTTKVTLNTNSSSMSCQSKEILPLVLFTPIAPLNPLVVREGLSYVFTRVLVSPHRAGRQ